MKKRYGKFNYKDFVGSYIVIAIMLLFTIISLFLELNIYICLVWLIDPIFRIYFISKPFRESFKLSENRIIIYKGKKEIERIILPNQYSLIVSYVDIKPTLFSYRTPIGNETHILKNKYAVSIIQNASIEEIIKKLHINNMKKYTTSVIEEVFNGNEFVYSFVCNQELFVKLSNKKATLIIPKSLINEIDVNEQNFNIYIDNEC